MKYFEIALLILAAMGCFTLAFADGALLLGQTIMIALGCLMLVGAMRLGKIVRSKKNTHAEQ